MELAELKPVATALVLPPGGLLLLALLGLLWARRQRGAGLALAGTSLLALWALSCHGVAVLLAQNLLPQVPPVQPDQLRQVQAIVVLGGGVLPRAPEYGAVQPGDRTLGRIRYAARLARQSGKPLAFAGGVGWSATGAAGASEAEVARRVLQEDYGLELRWLEDRSRDTRENALQMAQVLLPQQVRRIALVTDATHMPRALGHFRAAGFEVLPAPTDFQFARERHLLEWLPTARGLQVSAQVLREWLGQKLTGA
jgi:uncharacterized SAM-binding protein YcdF (DUF218 family)